MSGLIPEEISQTIKELCAEQGVVLLEIALRGSSHARIVEIFADSEQGMTHEICKALSDGIGEIFEKSAVFPGKYRLDISSPGIDRPLEFPWQYRKNIGRLAEVTLLDGTVKSGRISAANDDSVTLAPAPKKKSAKKKDGEGESEEIPFLTIKATTIQIEW